MTIKSLYLTLFLPAVAFADIRRTEGKWLISDYLEFPISALTREEAAKKYGRGLIIYRDWIAFGGESIKAPIYRAVKIGSEEEFVNLVGLSSKAFGGSIETMEVFEVYRHDGSRWMHPGGLLVTKPGGVFTIWDGLVFVFRKS